MAIKNLLLKNVSVVEWIIPFQGDFCAWRWSISQQQASTVELGFSFWFIHMNHAIGILSWSHWRQAGVIRPLDADWQQ